jgi:hypothetical protein
MNLVRERRRVRIDPGLRASLETLLASLPVLEDRRGSIPVEAEHLYLAAAFGGVNDLPRAKQVGPKAAHRELKKLNKLSSALVQHILSMHEDALDAVDGFPFQMIDGLRALTKVAATAELQPTSVGRNLHAKNRAGS